MTNVLSLLLIFFIRVPDTLSTVYGESWQGVQDPEHSNVIMQFMASNNLIFVVLGVSLIIWFVLITYLVRLEKKLNRLEQKKLEQTSESK